MNQWNDFVKTNKLRWSSVEPVIGWKENLKDPIEHEEKA